MYGCILADPPWTYDDTADAGKRGAAHKYSLLTDAALQSMPIAQLAAPDCVLFLWATFPKIHEALALIPAWGFVYKTVAFVWVKTSGGATGVAWGMGRWTRSNAELCILATRGRPKRADAGVHQIIFAPPAKHSAKPHETYNRIERLLPPCPRLELFARNERSGWDAWGNEVPFTFTPAFELLGAAWQPEEARI